MGKEFFALTLYYLKKRIDMKKQKKAHLEKKNGASYALFEFFWTLMIYRRSSNQFDCRFCLRILVD